MVSSIPTMTTSQTSAIVPEKRARIAIDAGGRDHIAVANHLRKARRDVPEAGQGHNLYSPESVGFGRGKLHIQSPIDVFSGLEQARRR